MNSESFIRKIKFLIIAMSVFTGLSAQHEGHEGESHDNHTEGNDQKGEIKDFIQHHLKDSYDFSLFSYPNDQGETVYVGFPLPVILYDQEDGLVIFSSSKFHHGEELAEVNGKFYRQYHGKIYQTDAQGTIEYDENHHATNLKPYDFSITKNVAMMFIVAVIMFFLFTNMAKSYAKNGGLPTSAGRFLEPIILYIRDDIARPNIGEKHYKRYMSYLLTIFFFIWFLNLFGLTPLGVNVTGNITVTLALALITYFITTLTANRNYWGHIFWMPGVPVPMKFILAPIELLGTFIKPFALMIRLYANMVAGHVVLMSIIGLIFVFKTWLGGTLSFGLAFALSILELLVAVLQAYIFTMLSALYFGMGVEEHHGDDH
jgi:F-type H+-transporting ATPase subunit a